VTYRDDAAARTARVTALIDEIAGLEHRRVSHAAIDERLVAAKHELATLQPPAPAPPRRPGALAHLVVFGATAGAAYLGTLWLR